MHTYLFELGHQPHISIAEIATVLEKRYSSLVTHQNYAELTTDEPLACAALQQQLGATISIREKTEHPPTVEGIVGYLEQTIPDGKIHFSVSGANAKQFALAAKKELKSHGRSVRYIEPKNAATILYNGLVDRGTDLLLEQKALWVTRGIQQFHKFKERDYDRPASDDKSGMLPPKLARTLINLTTTQTTATLYDPFCGSGTLLLEGLSLGYTTIIGSDISDKAVADSKENIAWMKQEESVTATTTISQHDITKPLTFVPAGSVDAIATEPYMGKPLYGRETRQQLLDQALELKDLYIKAFRTLKPVLSDNAIVVFVIPSFKHRDSWITIDCAEKITNMGFEIVPFDDGLYLRYHRPKQYLARDIWRFKKT